MGHEYERRGGETNMRVYITNEFSTGITLVT
jgi:hypothetical protein